MKNKNLRILFSFIVTFILAILGFYTKSQANSISKISMDIYIDNSGDATVTETWSCYVNQGTEVYHPYYNLGNSEITDLIVYEGTTTYTTLSSWNTSGSLSTKAYKCGINQILNGVELCWGISKYGSHTYKVQYKISKFVSELTDSQMIYWTLIPYDFSNSIGKVDIKIHADSYIQDTIDVWGYGNYGGLAYVNDGSIYMSSDGALDTSEYMTILVKFPLGTFNCTNKLNNNFDYYLNMAENGAKKYNNVISNWSYKFSFYTFGIIFIFAITFIKVLIGKNGHYRIKTIDFKIDNKDLRTLKKPNYYRDIPCNGDIYKAYYIAYQYGMLKNKTDFLGALILKWLKEGIVTLDEKEAGFIKKRMDTVVIFNTKIKEKITSSQEKELFDMMYEASGDGILEKKEFEKWCSGKYSKILDWFDTVLYIEKNKLINEELIIEKETKRMKIFTSKEYIPTEQLTEYAVQLAGLKKYLLEYTLIKEREPIEVNLFEDYLIYAQLMGIAKKVTKDFKDLYPDLIEQSSFSSYDNILFIHYCSSSGLSRANSARAAAQSYSSGGGGFSSRGGGGGSFGGGGGRWRIPLKLNIKYNKRTIIILLCVCFIF